MGNMDSNKINIGITILGLQSDLQHNNVDEKQKCKI